MNGMNLLTAIILYFLIWWVSIFMVLNLGYKADSNAAIGHDRSAPVKFDLWKKVALNSVIAAVIWLAIWLAVTYSGVSFREMVEGWK